MPRGHLLDLGPERVDLAVRLVEGVPEAGVLLAASCGQVAGGAVAGGAMTRCSSATPRIRTHRGRASGRAGVMSRLVHFERSDGGGRRGLFAKSRRHAGARCWPGADDGVVSSRRTSHLALAGAVAGLAGVAVSQVVTTVLGTRATPVLAVAEAVIELTPGPVAESLIPLVGTWDKPLLVGGVTAAVIGLAALAGVLSRRSVALGNAVLLVMGAVALVALVTGPDFGATTVLPLAAGVATWLVVLAVLADRAPRAADTSRRSFLLASGTVAAASLLGVVGARVLGRGRDAVETTRRLLRLPVGRGAVPAGAEVGLADVTPWRVPSAEFYRIDTALVVPAVDPNEWRLRIHGMVDREITLTYADLLERRLTEAWVTLCCVSNEVGGDLIGNAWWSGVRVADLLAEAGVSPDADAVRQTSEDGWSCGTPLSALTDDRDALLAIAMNGEPLPLEHGFPVRMVVPGLYGFVSATKWVVDLEVTRFDRFAPTGPSGAGPSEDR